MTVEDHWPEGGLGDAVLVSALADTDDPPRVVKLAVREMPRSGQARRAPRRSGDRRRAHRGSRRRQLVAQARAHGAAARRPPAALPSARWRNGRIAGPGRREASRRSALVCRRARPARGQRREAHDPRLRRRGSRAATRRSRRPRSPASRPGRSRSPTTTSAPKRPSTAAAALPGSRACTGCRGRTASSVVRRAGAAAPTETTATAVHVSVALG